MLIGVVEKLRSSKFYSFLLKLYSGLFTVNIYTFINFYILVLFLFLLKFGLIIIVDISFISMIFYFGLYLIATIKDYLYDFFIKKLLISIILLIVVSIVWF